MLIYASVSVLKLVWMRKKEVLKISPFITCVEISSKCFVPRDLFLICVVVASCQYTLPNILILVRSHSRVFLAADLGHVDLSYICTSSCLEH